MSFIRCYLGGEVAIKDGEVTLAGFTLVWNTTWSKPLDGQEIAVVAEIRGRDLVLSWVLDGCEREEEELFLIEDEP